MFIYTSANAKKNTTTKKNMKTKTSNQHTFTMKYGCFFYRSCHISYYLLINIFCKVKTFICINQENLGFFLYLPITFQEIGKFGVS